MSGRASPLEGPALVRQAAELKLWSRRRATALRWSACNGALLLLLAYDLSCACPGRAQPLHVAEMLLAAVACANLLQHALRLLPRRACVNDEPTPLTKQQRRLLGLTDSELDSSFRLVEACGASRSASSLSASGASADASLASSRDADASALDSSSLSLAQSWRRPPEPPQPPSPDRASPLAPQHPRDVFIADALSLSDYIRDYEQRRARETGNGAAATGVGPAWGAPPPPVYQLASLDFESSKLEDRSGTGAGGAAGGAGVALAAELCHLDPQRLTQYNYNLRLWIQLTILERLAAELSAGDAALQRMGLALRLGGLARERLRALAQGASAPRPLKALLPFLEPFADQSYVVQRIRELAAGGCLSAYRWDAGGADWAPGKPTDAELLLHLFASYLDAQLPPHGNGDASQLQRPFSADHVSCAPAPPPPTGPSVHRTSRGPAPPHYVLAWRGRCLEVGMGRCNLLHVLLLLLAALAQHEPPALHRLHLGPAGLNMLWIIGR